MNTRKHLTRVKGATVAQRFGFLGLGMAGGSIAAACANMTIGNGKTYPYKAVLVNSNRMDLEKTNSRNPNVTKLLIGDGLGAGRDVKIGSQLFEESSDKILESLQQNLGDVDFLWIVAGLGGGTGTGSILGAIQMAITNGFDQKIGLILTIPRENEGPEIYKNAVSQLKFIASAYNAFGAMIVVDNEKLFREYSIEHPKSQAHEYALFANRFTAEALHELNVITSSFRPQGVLHFDGSEFKKRLRHPGFMHISRLSLPASVLIDEESAELDRKLEELIQEGTLSDSFDLAEANHVAVSMFAEDAYWPKVFKTSLVNKIEGIIRRHAPNTKDRPVSYYGYPGESKSLEESEVHIFVIFNGMQTSTRLQQMIVDTEAYRREEKEKKQKQTNKMASLFGDFSSDDEDDDAEPTPDKSDIFGFSKSPAKSTTNKPVDAAAILEKK